MAWGCSFDRIKPVVGEYAGDHGFSLPNPVSIHREYPRSRFRVEWCMQTLQKNEDTWCEVLEYFIYQIRYSPESIRGVVAQTTPHTQTATRAASCSCVTSISATAGGTRTTTGSTTTGTATTLRLCVLFSLFLSRLFVGRVFFMVSLFRKLPAPTTEHSADFLYIHRKSGILLRIN